MLSPQLKHALNYMIQAGAAELHISSLMLKGALPVDIHVLKAMEIFQCTQEQVTPEMRRQAKVVNFGQIFSTTSIKEL